MIIEKKGDLLTVPADIIAHQVNCKGVMGAGVAKQIKEQLLDANVFLKYKTICERSGNQCLGDVLYLPTKKGGMVANLFGEDVPTGNKEDTNYQALLECFETLEMHCRVSKNYSMVAIPGYLGCGLAGGDWESVYTDILVPTFQNSPVNLVIVYREEGVERLWASFMKQSQKEGKLLTDWHRFKAGDSIKRIFEYFIQSFG